jgi:hypothetical protein
MASTSLSEDLGTLLERGFVELEDPTIGEDVSQLEDKKLHFVDFFKKHILNAVSRTRHAMIVI